MAKKRSRPKKNRKARAVRKPRGRLLRWFFLLCFWGFLILACYTVYLDFEVRKKFEGKRFELPAKVFARPLELYAGKSLTKSELLFELDLVGYKEARGGPLPGEYRVAGNRITLVTRTFEFWDGIQDSKQVEIEFAGNQVVRIVDGRYQSELDLLRLEPAAIGGIYPSKNEDRELVRFSDVPRHFIDALIATEDKRFYFHHGVDLRALARAAVSTLSGGEVQGGSTITQQLVKNFYLTPERTLTRKFNEMLMALLLEWHYEKNDILETYINEVYFGQDGSRAIHGVGLASRFYFGRHVNQLEPQHSALLVAMLKGPAYYNPRRNAERALKRRNLVLTETHNQGFLAQWEYDKAKYTPLGVVPKRAIGLSRYPAFNDMVIAQLQRDYKDSDLRTEGLRIFTTLDPIIQRHAEETVQRRLEALESGRKLPENLLEAAVVITNRFTGEVEAVVGGRSAKFEGFNRALNARRQVGSLFKPVVYLTAFLPNNGYTLSSTLDDSPLVWEVPGSPPWQPNNYDNQFHGEVPAWLALAKSYNVASARLGLELGLPAIFETAHQLGLQEPLAAYASTLLGTSELTVEEVTQMYQTLGAGGFYMPLRAIREVLTREGQPLRRYGIEGHQAVDELAVYLVNRALQLVVSEGTGSGLQWYLPAQMQAAGKTGTTDDLRDSWFAGFSGAHVAVVWLGNDNNESIRLTGAAGAMTVWGGIMQGLNPRPLKLALPEDVEEIAVHREQNVRVDSECKTAIVLPFVEGSAPEMQADCSGANAAEVKKRSWWRKLIN